MSDGLQPVPVSPEVRAVAPARSSLAVLGISALVVVALYIGREVFVPVALAVLLSFVLAPLVRLLQGWHVPRGVAVASVVLFAFIVISVLAAAMAGQVAQLAGDLPRYESTIRSKIASLRGAPASAGGTLERAADMLKDLSKELERPRISAPPANPLATGAPSGEIKPIPVEVRQPDPGALQTLGAFITPLLHPLATMGIMIIFVVFILLQREDLRNRLIRLAGSHDIQRTTAAIDDAAHRLSKLYLTQLALNTGYGVVVGTGLWLIGIPSAALWGLLAAVLRFVPYVGAVISAIFPLVLAAAVDPGWTMLLWTAALFLIVEPLVGHVIEPLLFGHSTGLSPVAVVASATFWTWLWGPIGLVLATPLTVCLVVLGRHIEYLEFLDVMLGDRPPLTAPQIFYQRMLAADPAEAAEKAEEFLKERSLSTYYDEVALAGLRLALLDYQRGALEPARLITIKETVEELVEDLSDHEDAEPPKSQSTHDTEAVAAIEATHEEPSGNLPKLSPEDLAQDWRGEAPILCVAGQSALDEAVAAMLAQLLAKHGLGARVAGSDMFLKVNLSRMETKGLAMICLCYLDARTPVHMRYAIRRIRRRLTAKVLLGCWSLPGGKEQVENLRETTRADLIATNLREAVALCIAAAGKDKERARADAAHEQKRRASAP